MIRLYNALKWCFYFLDFSSISKDGTCTNVNKQVADSLHGKSSDYKGDFTNTGNGGIKRSATWTNFMSANETDTKPSLDLSIAVKNLTIAPQGAGVLSKWVRKDWLPPEQAKDRNPSSLLQSVTTDVQCPPKYSVLRRISSPSVLGEGQVKIGAFSAVDQIDSAPTQQTTKLRNANKLKKLKIRKDEMNMYAPTSM